MIILASKSHSRQTMLANASVEFRAMPADLDERVLEKSLGDTEPGEIALALARAKALAVSERNPGALVLGSDSLVTVDGMRFDKPADRDDALRHLRFFSGKQMQLHSAAALARCDEVLFAHSDMAQLSVRKLSEAFIEAYLDEEWPEVGNCVGVFRIEGRGVHLFEHIEGDQFTVLGMPLLPVLGALRELGELVR